MLVFHYSITGRPGQRPERLRLQALELEAEYTDENGNVRDGASLMNVGIPVNTRGDREAQLFVYRKKG